MAASISVAKHHGAGVYGGIRRKSGVVYHRRARLAYNLKHGIIIGAQIVTRIAANA